MVTAAIGNGFFPLAGTIPGGVRFGTVSTIGDLLDQACGRSAGRTGIGRSARHGDWIGRSMSLWMSLRMPHADAQSRSFCSTIFQ
ncbi:MAG: hypothetical protein WDO24_28605 [Pseudomonadota bacterium]